MSEEEIHKYTVKIPIYKTLDFAEVEYEQNKDQHKQLEEKGFTKTRLNRPMYYHSDFLPVEIFCFDRDDVSIIFIYDTDGCIVAFAVYDKNDRFELIERCMNYVKNMSIAEINFNTLYEKNR